MPPQTGDQTYQVIKSFDSKSPCQLDILSSISSVNQTALAYDFIRFRMKNRYQKLDHHLATIRNPQQLSCAYQEESSEWVSKWTAVLHVDHLILQMTEGVSHSAINKSKVVNINIQFFLED